MPPVALTPQPGAAPAGAVPALAEELASEAKKLASTIGSLWFISELKNQPKWAKIHTFCRRLAMLGRLPEVQQQFAGYRLHREKTGRSPHKLDSWLGTPISDYADGEWTGCDWPAAAAAATTHSGQPVEASIPARATTSARKQQPQEW